MYSVLGRRVLQAGYVRPHVLMRRQFSLQNMPAPKPEQQKSLMQRVKDEAVHYWHGTRLLAKEMRISTRLLWKVMRGFQLTRRENQQLVRTGKDVFRLIPFAVFVIVPFMEFLLPVALKLFPNMLPSTYAQEKDEDAKRRKLLASKLQMAKFLRDSIAESALHQQQHHDENNNVTDFTAFFKKYRSSGDVASTQQILEICKRFSDDFTLDHLSRPQLVTLARFLGMSNAWGTDNFLRLMIHRKLQEIKRDDKAIQREGIDSLTMYELITACQARGIRTVDVTSDRLRFELQQWLDLHLKNNVPPTLVILSRALMLTDRPATTADQATAEALQTTLTSLPNEVVEEAELRLSEKEGRVSFKKKLDIIEKEEQRIQQESSASAQETEAKETVDSADIGPSSKEEPLLGIDGEVMTDTDDKLTDEQVRELSETLSVVHPSASTNSSSSSSSSERTELEELKQARSSLQQHTTSLDASSKRQLSKMDELIREIEDYLAIMDSDPAQLRTELRDNKENITTEELETAIRLIRDPPDEKRIKRIVKKLDTDGDGRVFIDEIMQMAQDTSSSNSSTSGDEVKREGNKDGDEKESDKRTHQ